MNPNSQWIWSPMEITFFSHVFICPLSLKFAWFEGGVLGNTLWNQREVSVYWATKLQSSGFLIYHRENHGIVKTIGALGNMTCWRVWDNILWGVEWKSGGWGVRLTQLSRQFPVIAAASILELSQPANSSCKSETNSKWGCMCRGRSRSSATMGTVSPYKWRCWCQTLNNFPGVDPSTPLELAQPGVEARSTET